MTDIDDLTEDDVPDLSEDDLERFVAEWLNVGFVECRECDGRGYQYKGRFAPDCWKCGGTGDYRPKYTSDPAAAWQLLERIPGEVIRSNAPGRDEKWYLTISGPNPVVVYHDQLKRAVTEAAAILRIRDVEPRKLDG